MKNVGIVTKQQGTDGQTTKFFAIRWLLAILLVLALSGAAAAQDKDDERCSNAAAAGKWGFTTTGTVFLPAGAVSVAIAGRFKLDASGNLSGTQTRSLNGTINQETFDGTITVNSDCTATASINVFHSGVLNRTATVNLVFVNDLREFRGVFTSAIAHPSGASIATVLIMDGKKVFREG